MDQIDQKILEFLQEDANQTAKEMAEKLSLTTTPIYERIKKLEKSGVIKKYVAILDHEILGLGLTVFMNITIKEHQQKHRQLFVNSISKLEDVIDLYHTSGAYDFLAKVRFKNVKAYKDFLVNDLAAIENIGDIDSQIVLDEIKTSTRVPLSF